MKRVFLSFFLFIIVNLAVVNLAFNPVAEKVILHYYGNLLNDYYRELIRGTNYLLIEELKRIPEKQRPRHIERLQAQFGYPIGIQPGDSGDLTTEDRNLLSADQTVVKNDGELFYQRIDGSDQLLVMGPIEDPSINILSLNLVVLGALIVFLTPMALIWSLPFWRKLNHISKAAKAFGNGRLETRARVPRRSALAPMAEAFNRMADRIQQLIDTRKELTNAVSHELRTPISRIRFGLEMLDTASKTADRKHYAAEILKDVDELDELVSESLAYARFDRGVPDIDWQRHLLEPWLQEVVAGNLTGHPHIEYNCNNLLSRREREGHFEPRFMGRAIGNLVQNAVRHANHRVVVTLAEENDHCLIHVDDDGPGVPEADRGRVFKAFTRLDTSRSRESGGFGLGLAIVQRVVAWHGGETQVARSPLGGARFTISWPGFSATLPDISGASPP